MGARPDYRNPLVAFRTPDAPRLVTRKLYKSTLALTEVQGAANHGVTPSLPYDDAYLYNCDCASALVRILLRGPTCIARGPSSRNDSDSRLAAGPGR